MIMSIRDAVEILVGLGLIFLCFKFYEDKRKNTENGKIEIKFTKSEGEEAANTVKFTDLILEIKYRVIKRSRYNKEETAILISDFVRQRCKSFSIGYSNQKTLEEIKNIIEKIKPLLSHKTESELTYVNYRFFEKTIPRWSKDIFSESCI